MPEASSYFGNNSRAAHMRFMVDGVAFLIFQFSTISDCYISCLYSSLGCLACLASMRLQPQSVVSYVICLLKNITGCVCCLTVQPIVLVLNEKW
jgi:hypothetical protein